MVYILNVRQPKLTNMSYDEQQQERMKKMNEKEMRNANGGSYCKVCGYSNWNEWKVMRHIASRHPAVVLRTMWNLATSQANAIAKLIRG